MTALPDFVVADAELSTRTTLALPGRAALLATVRSLAELRRAAPLCERRFVLGGGSNLVLTGDFDGLLFHIAIPGRALAVEDDEARYVRAGAGENWHEFVCWTLAQGWGGLENLAGIPGTVGAAPIQNIGAYGLEVAERFHSLTAFDLQTGTLAHFDRAACRFGYRDSLFKQQGWHLHPRFVIVEVTFRLAKDWRPQTGYADIAAELDTSGIDAPTPRQLADAVVAVRQRKLPDPARLPNAGSFFQNPLVDTEVAARILADHPGVPHYRQPDGRVKLAAGWLIEQSGWKGRALGTVGMYQRQALVLVNHGHATGRDVLALMQAVQRDVRTRFGVALDPEPVFL